MSATKEYFLDKTYTVCDCIRYHFDLDDSDYEILFDSVNACVCGGSWEQWERIYGVLGDVSCDNPLIDEAFAFWEDAMSHLFPTEWERDYAW